MTHGAKQGESRPDRWAHRRGEPRVFALLLSVYLLLAALTTVLVSPALGEPSEATLRRGAGMLLLIVSLAVSVLWPMLRLSQAAPERPASAALADWVVVALLAQAVVWPMTLLPGGALIRPVPWPGLWPWSVSAGVGLSLASWALLIGSLVALGTASGRPAARVAWMIVILIVALAGPAAGWALAGVRWADWVGLASPITAPRILAASPSGLLPRVSAGEWAGSLAPAFVSLPVWMLARRRR
ncbi:MAG: hypothetical protein D6693_10775 [Planctomycetota bacterium]|nr:MAG: hypothetical protein D6693_10775 [Planctomycetota bacterium]